MRVLLKQKSFKPICQLQARQCLIVDLITDCTHATGFTGELVNENPSLLWVGIFQIANLLREKGFFPGDNDMLIRNLSTVLNNIHE